MTLFFAVGQTLSTAAAGLIGEATGSFTSSYLASALLTGIAFFLLESHYSLSMEKKARSISH